MAHTTTDAGRQPQPPRPRSDGQRRPITPWRLGLGAVVAFVVLMGTVGLSHGHIKTGDTPGLVRGARVALDCIGTDGRWSSCGTVPRSHDTTVGPFPLLQYLPAAAMVRAR